MQFYLYILRLQSGGLYIGCTKNIRKRYQDHFNGRGCRTTKSDPPVEPIYHERFDSFSAARKREAQIKRWSRAKKEALVAGDLEKLKLLSKSKH
ncbi:MAG: GIY-YIG nuclease family protein [Deltaproteobacteria bacterium]|nr:GIY-YIG nuclease family protein [Deltaproteobacteria bacterium]